MKIEVELVGGLGNQLFGYYAGLYLKNEFQGELTLNISNLNSKSNTSADVSALNLEPHFLKQNKYHNNFAEVYIRRARDKILLELPQSKNIIYPCTQLVTDSSDLKKLKRKSINRILLRGYFGNFSYFEEIKETSIMPSVRNPSTNYSLLSTRAEEIKPIMMHIRRGDYVTHAHTYGLLSRNYYQKALEFAMGETGTNEVWVFSDDQEAARKLTSKLPGTFSFIEGDHQITPVEALMLQSKGSANITANSTFSAWAAALNSGSCIKICPNQYFTDGRHTENWPPRNWIALDSSWE